MTRRGGHAVVLGASLSGLLATRVLSEFYDAVTVIDRDDLPDGPHHRRGVPQARHAHVLLARGSQAIDELYPGILDDLVAAGTPVLDGDLSKVHLAPQGHLLCQEGRRPDPVPLYVPSRPNLEARVRQRTRDLANVRILDGHDITGLATSVTGERVVDVRLNRRADGRSETIASAALIVDATGRASRMPAWLDALGYDKPVEELVDVDIRYASQLLRMPKTPPPEKLILVGARPGRPKGLALLAYEDATWGFTVGAVGGHRPPRQRTGMIDYVRELVPAHVTDALQGAEPLNEVATYRLPSSRWRRYDKLRRFPDGLLVFGDAICSYNPLYGQGTTIAALQALALRDCLSDGDHRLARRFFRSAARPIRAAWEVVVGGDLALPEVPGSLPTRGRIVNAYLERLLTAAETDPYLTDRFLRVSGLTDQPSTLLRPSVARRVLLGTMPHRATIPPVTHATRGERMAAGRNAS